MHHLPHGQPPVGGGVPVVGQLHWFQQAHAASARPEDPGLDQALDADVLRLRQDLRLAVVAFVEVALGEPGQRPPGVAVELTLLLGQCLVQDFVDDRQCFAYGHLLPRGIENAGVAGEDRHARPDCGLGQVHRGNARLLEVDERRRQFAFQGITEFPPGRRRGIRRPLPTGKNDTRRKGVRLIPDRSSLLFTANGPCTTNTESGLDDSVEEGFPPGASRSGPAVVFRLSKRVIDAERESSMCPMCQSNQHDTHSIEEEGVCRLAVSLSVRRSNQLLDLRDRQRGEQIRTH